MQKHSFSAIKQPAIQAQGYMPCFWLGQLKERLMFDSGRAAE